MTSSDAFKDLSNSAVRVYVNILMEDGGSINFTGNIYADVLASSRQKTAKIIEFKLAN